MSEQRFIKTSRILLFSLILVQINTSFFFSCPLSSCSSVKWIWQQLSTDSLCQDIGPQHRQWFTPESWGESFLFWARASRIQVSISLPLPCTAVCRKSLSFCRGASSFSLFTSPHRLWSPSSPLAGTLPRTRERGRRTLSTTATRSTQTQPTTRSRSTRHILIKREWNQNTHLISVKDNSWQDLAV